MMKKTFRRPRSAFTVVLAMVAALAMSVTAAFAQYPPDEDFAVTGPDSVAVGATAQFGVVGATDGETVTVTAEVDGVQVLSETYTAGADGEIAFGVTVPGDATVGASGSVTAQGTTESDTLTFSVVAADAEPVDDEVEPVAAEERLPVTGGQVLLLTLLGIGLVGGGALALRKRSVA